MVFSSYLFLFFFLPLALLGCYVVPVQWRNLVLTLFSFLFYGWANPFFLLLMGSTIFVDYTDGRLMFRFPEKKSLFLGFSLLFDLAVLGYFKYWNFGVDNYNLLMETLGIPSAQWQGFFRIVLPLGISFYTFQSLSYVIDVYRGTANPVRSLADYACYVSMFPQLVAGPILRFSDVSAQLQNRTCSWEKFARGCAFFMLGMGKKVLIANPCGKIADSAFGALDLPAFDAWYGMFAYAFQIYFDFSGYSDMAIGLGLMLGFVFPKNFDSPYHSRNIPEYWQRWHISLSAWLKDYLFFPLLRSHWCMTLARKLAESGHKKLAKSLPQALALLILWTAVGLWHGAEWTFVVFGLYHGFFLILDVFVTAFRKKKKGEKTFLPDWIKIVSTFLIACFGHVLFRAEDLADAGHYFVSLAGLSTAEPLPFVSLMGLSTADPLPGTAIRVLTLSPFYGTVFLLGGVLIWCAPQVWDFTRKLTVPKMVWCLIVLLLSVLALSVQSYNPFIYFTF